MKSEDQKNYRLSDDPGYARKIVFVNKNSNDFESPSISKLIPIIEAAGNEEKFKGYFASAPTVYAFIEGFDSYEFERQYRYQGSIYERQKCSHPDVVVYSHIMKLDSYQEGSAAGKFIKDLMTEFSLNEGKEV